MNDRFRFRFWNRITNKYEELGNFPNDVDEFFLYHGEYCIIEQCTWIKDKNGKLVCEGDIVKNGKEIAEVLWNKDGGFELVGKCWIAPSYFTNLKNWEIIGNVHENPELLENK